MNKATIKIKILSEEALLPRAEYEGDAGLDLFSIDEAVIKPQETALIGTGIAVELPVGTEAQVRPRSGLALQHSVTVLNSPGTIDCGYRGEIRIILINHGKRDFVVKKNMKIAQLVVKPILHVVTEVVEELAESQRSVRGFGSSGM